MRLFIAIQFDADMRDALTDYRESLMARGVEGNYTRRENLHITLAFIGDHGNPDDVLDAMEQVSFRPFDIAPDGVGSFGDLFWVGLADNPGLAAYVKRLRRALSAHGIPYDKKRFSPHITLIRKASYRGGGAVPAGEPPKGSMTAYKVSLMRSDRGKQGMIYTEVGSVMCEGYDAIERVMRMEKDFDRALQLMKHCEEGTADAGAGELGNLIKRLDRYYSGRQWKEDFAADEKGAFPAGLKRGVLSEDGLYELLERYRETEVFNNEKK